MLPNIDVLVDLKGRIRFEDENGHASGSPQFKSVVCRFRDRPFGFHVITMDAEEGR